jgi:hypothetical protein
MSYQRGFKIAVITGVIANDALALGAIFAPDGLLSALHFDAAYPDLWVRFSGLLLFLLGLFYLPGGLDPRRYRANAWLSLVSRAAGVVFFAACVALLGMSQRFLLFSGFDMFFGLWAAPFLIASERRDATGAP